MDGARGGLGSFPVGGEEGGAWHLAMLVGGFGK